MLDFEFYAPTRIIFGKSAMNSLADQLKLNNVKKPMLLHYGKDTPKAPLEQTIQILKENNIPFVEFAGIKANPTLERALEGIQIAKDEQVDFLLAVGGGSVIDTAKTIGAGVLLAPGVDIWKDHIWAKRLFDHSLPIGVILTLPATGSEGSFGLCIQKGTQKRYDGCWEFCPKFTIENPEFTMTLPPYQTACGVYDIVSHLIERYFVNFANEDLTDRMLDAALRCMLHNGPILMRDPNNYAMRAEVMWCSTVAHNKILEVGRTHGDWASHDMSHELSGFYDLAHGAALSIIHPAWMRYVWKSNPAKFEQFARRVFDVDFSFDRQEETILEMVNRLENFSRSLNLPIRMCEVGIDDSRFEEMIKSAMDGRFSIGNGFGVRMLLHDDIREIFKMALK